MKVRGKNILISILDGATWKPYGCATDASLEVITESVETSVVGSGSFATFLPSKNSFTGTLDGFTTLADASLISLKRLREMQIAGTKFQMKFHRETENNDIYLDTAEFFITDSTDTSAHVGFNTFSITVQGTGTLDISGGTTPPVTTPYDIFYGHVSINTTIPYANSAARWAAIKAAVQNAITANEYSTLTVGDVNDNDILVNFTEPGQLVRFIVFPLTVADFLFWSEINNPFQQNLSITINGATNGVFSKDSITAGKMVATLYQTEFSNKIKFSR